jgi:predicted enzyme related to lactoylglutathione lyase
MSTGTETTVGQFVWHDHGSSDVERAKSFYGELLGWQIELWKPGEMDYPMITVNGSMHGGFGPAPEGVPPHWLGHVRVEDVDATAKRAEQAGGSVLMGPMDIPEVGRMAVIRDPQGAVLSAFQAAGDMPAVGGVFVWDELTTTDVEGAKRFYGELFAWTANDMPMGEAGTYTLFKSGERDVAGCMASRGGEAPPHWLVYLATGDVDASTAKARDLGATVYVEPTDIPDMGRFSVVQDPTGAVFGLFQSRSA